MTGPRDLRPRAELPAAAGRVDEPDLLAGIEPVADEGVSVRHVMVEVELTCDRVVLLHRGRVLAAGTVDEILRRTGRSQFTRAFLDLGEAHDAAHPATEGAP